MESETWSGNWQERIEKIVRAMGYTDVFEFVESHPGRSFGELFGILRNASQSDSAMIAFVQLPELYFADAAKRQLMRDAIREALVRSLQQFLKSGWNLGKKVRERRLDAKLNWQLPGYEFERWEQLKDEAWSQLESMHPDDDWCPGNREDPIIEKVFSHVWPLLEN
ncbi:hypothetical protein L0222_12120 [bacterium]|nr:hypothetical protein [bacterium]